MQEHPKKGKKFDDWNREFLVLFIQIIYAREEIGTKISAREGFSAGVKVKTITKEAGNDITFYISCRLLRGSNLLRVELGTELGSPY